jgi:hypothetical protein
MHNSPTARIFIVAVKAERERAVAPGGCPGSLMAKIGCPQ